MERAVELMEMLEARDRRARRQRELLERYRLPLISFTMNKIGRASCRDRVCMFV